MTLAMTHRVLRDLYLVSAEPSALPCGCEQQPHRSDAGVPQGVIEAEEHRGRQGKCRGPRCSVCIQGYSCGADLSLERLQWQTRGHRIYRHAYSKSHIERQRYR